MKVLVTGSRTWVSPEPIRRELEKFPPGTILVHGACRGVDNIAADEAKNLGFEVRAYPVTNAEWKLKGGGAGHDRNQRMLDKEHPDQDGVCIDVALAFHQDVGLGKGTRDMMQRVDGADPTIEKRVTIRRKG
jgi:hypothetical protein